MGGWDLRYGWMGDVLFVDLSMGKIVRMKLDPSLVRFYLGGRGLNSYTLFRMIGGE